MNADARRDALADEIFDRALGRFGDAEPLFALSLEIFAEHLAEGHPTFGRVWRGIGTLRLDQGNLEEAAEALGRARAIYEASGSARWPARLDVLLAECRRRQGRLAEAGDLLLAAEPRMADDPRWRERWAEERESLDRLLAGHAGASRP